MRKYLVKKIVTSIFLVLGVIFVSFIMLHLIPGDPAINAAPLFATAEQIARVRAELHLDEPLHIQFLIYMSEILQGDFGTSVVTYRSVITELIPRFFNTLLLASVASLIAVVVGVSAGIIAALHHNTKVDTIVTGLSIITITMPSFLFSIILLYIFSLNLRIFPSYGFSSPISIVLPAIALSTWSLAIIARLTRTKMIEVLNQDYIRTMRSAGLPERLINFKYALKNTLIPVLVVMAVQFGYSIAGSVFVESVFSWPGIGYWLITAINQRDFSVIRAGILVISLVFIAANTLADVAITFIDPRIRFS